MEIGIIGLPNSGKTTIFNALTRSHTAANASSRAKVQANTAVVDVPDERVDRLSAMFQPKRTTYAQVTYHDISGWAAGANNSGFAGPLLNSIAVNDALMLVARAFVDESVAHTGISVDPGRDLVAVETELILNDMTIFDKRLARLSSMKSRGTVDERKRMADEETLLLRLMALLEQDAPLRVAPLTLNERKILSGFGLLSLKPLLQVVNAGDEALETDYADLLGDTALFLRGRLEAEIAQMNSEDAAEYLTSFGICESGLYRAIRICYRMLGLQTFFTVGADEVRAWTIRSDTLAADAAGIVHSDLKRGFIRAEAIAYNDLMEQGSLVEARKHGKLRLEGKEYEVADGDILTFRFNL